MSNSIAANDIIQNIDELLAEYPVDECISILQEVVKQIDVRCKDFSEDIEYRYDYYIYNLLFRRRS